MTAVHSPGKVLVTGANGYIGMWIVRILLEQGYIVRGAVRSQSKGKYLTRYFQQMGFGADKLEIVVVDDLTKQGAFDQAVQGVDAVQHVAAPVDIEVSNPQGITVLPYPQADATKSKLPDFMKPAVQGTVGILRSALEHGNNIRRIILTSSCAAVMSVPKVHTVFTEDDWNTESIEDVEVNGSHAKPESAYLASKTIAERAAWEFWEKHKREIKWDLVAIDPSVVFGPCIHEITHGPTNLNASLKWLYDTVVNTSSQPDWFLRYPFAWVDVRDVALGHVLSLQREAAGGERIIMSNASFVFHDLVGVAKKIKPFPLRNHPPPKAIEGLEALRLVEFKTENWKRSWE